MAEQRRSAIGNERVGARLGRLFQRNRTQEERDILEAYRTQTPVDEIRRRRAAAEAPAPSPAAEARREDSESPTPAPTAPADEVRAAAATRNATRTQRRPNTRMTPSAAPREMTADELNALSMGRGEGSESEAAANIRRRLGEMDAGMKKGGAVKKMAKGGVVKKMATGGASRRGDGCAARGKTKGRMV